LVISFWLLAKVDNFSVAKIRLKFGWWVGKITKGPWIDTSLLGVCCLRVIKSNKNRFFILILYLTIKESFRNKQNLSMLKTMKKYSLILVFALLWACKSKVAEVTPTTTGTTTTPPPQLALLQYLRRLNHLTGQRQHMAKKVRPTMV